MEFSRFRHALRGLGEALKGGELLPHIVTAAGVVLFGFLVCLDRVSWALVVLAVGLVFSAETVNSAVEALGDAIATHRHPGVGRAKDIAAGAVLLVAITAALLGLLAFLPVLLQGGAGSCHHGALSAR